MHSNFMCTFLVFKFIVRFRSKFVFLGWKSCFQVGYIDVGDGCWRRNQLVTTFICWWRNMSPRYRCWHQHIKKVIKINPWHKDANQSPTLCLQHRWYEWYIRDELMLMIKLVIFQFGETIGMLVHKVWGLRLGIRVRD